MGGENYTDLFFLPLLGHRILHVLTRGSTYRVSYLMPNKFTKRIITSTFSISGRVLGASIFRFAITIMTSSLKRFDAATAMDSILGRSVLSTAAQDLAVFHVVRGTRIRRLSLARVFGASVLRAGIASRILVANVSNGTTLVICLLLPVVGSVSVSVVRILRSFKVLRVPVSSSGSKVDRINPRDKILRHSITAATRVALAHSMSHNAIVKVATRRAIRGSVITNGSVRTITPAVKASCLSITSGSTVQATHEALYHSEAVRRRPT